MRLFAVWMCTILSCLQHMSYQCHIMDDNGAVVSLQECHVTCHIVCVKIHLFINGKGISYPLPVSCLSVYVVAN